MDPQTLAQATLYVMGLFLRYLVAADEAADREAVNIHGADAWRAARMLWAALDGESALRQQIVAQAKTPQPDLAGVRPALADSFEHNPTLAGSVASVLAHSPYAGLLGSDTGPLRMPSPELARQAEAIAPDHLAAEHNRMLRTVVLVSGIRWVLTGAMIALNAEIGPAIFILVGAILAGVALSRHLKYLGPLFATMFSFAAMLPVAPWMLLATTISSRSRHNPASETPLRYVWLMGVMPFIGLATMLIFQPLPVSIVAIPELTLALVTSSGVLVLGTTVLFVLFWFKLARSAWTRAMLVALFNVLCAFPAIFTYVRVLNSFLYGPDF